MPPAREPIIRRRPKPKAKPRRRPVLAPPNYPSAVPARPGAVTYTPARSRQSKPAPKPTKRQVRLAKAQERAHEGQGRAVERAARQQRRVKQRAARRKYFPKDPIRGVLRAERDAVRSLAELRASRPEWYASKKQEAKDPKILGVNIAKPARDANKFLVRSARIMERAHEKTRARGRIAGKIPVRLSGAGDNRELRDLVASAPTTAYLTGAAAFEAVKGDTSRAKRLWKEYKDTSAVSAAVSGNFKEAAKRAHERPITTGLELWGGKAVVGRGAGAWARGGPVPKGFRQKVRQAGSTRRENLRLYPDAINKKRTGPEEARAYSKDIINKAAQVAMERRARRKGRDPNVARGPYAQRPGGPPPQADRGGAVSKLRRRTDTRVHQQDITSRKHKVEAALDVRAILEKLKKKEVAGVQGIAEGTFRVTSARQLRADINKRLGQLAKERPGLKGERLRLNRAEAKHWRELKNMPDDRLLAAATAAEQFGKQQKSVQARGRRAGTWDETGQAKRFYPALQSHIRRQAREERTGLSGKRTSADEATLARFMDEHPEIEDVLAKPRKDLNPSERSLLRRYFMARSQAMDERSIAAKKLQQRYTKGKDLPSGALEAAIAAERAFEARMRAKVPGADVAALVADIYSGRPRVGKPKPVRREDFGAYLDKIRRRKHVPSRLLRPEEIAEFKIDRTLQRRARQGKAGLSGMIEGGPVLVSQRPGHARLGSRLRGRAPYEPMNARTGVGYQQGARPVGREALIRQAVESEAAVTAAEGHNLFLREMSVPAGKNGRQFGDSHAEVVERARELTLDENGELRPDAMPLVPVNLAQFQTFGARLMAKQEQAMPRRQWKDAVNSAWASVADESGRGKWALVPEDVIDRVLDHASVRNFGALNRLTNHFKDVVLTSSSPSRWIGGNITDLSLRAAMAGLTPLDVIRGRQIVRRTAKEGLQGEQAAVAVAGGGMWHASSALDRSVRPLRGAAGENPARTVLAAPWRAWKGAVYAFEHFIEELPQFGAVGKAMRKQTGRSVPVRAQDWGKADAAMKRDLKTMLKLHDQQIDNFAVRLAKDRAFEAQIQAITESVIGRWGKISPAMRRALVIAPFAQWLGAATRYVFITLPAEHPIKTGMLAAMSEMTEKERAALGLSYMLPRNKQVYDYQQGSIPTSVGRNEYGPVVEGVPTARMTSFGTAGGVPGNIGGFLMPQFAGAIDAWAGTSFTGEPLVYPDWWPDEDQRRLPLPPEMKDKIGMGALLEASVPFASAFRRAVLQKGAPAEPWSTILTPATRKKWDKENERYTENKGTVTGGILEWLSPVAPAGRLYRFEAGKAIEEGRIAVEQVEKWQKNRAKAKTGDIFSPRQPGEREDKRDLFTPTTRKPKDRRDIFAP